MSPVDSHDYHLGQLSFFSAYFPSFRPSIPSSPSLRPLGLFLPAFMHRCTVPWGGPSLAAVHRAQSRSTLLPRVITLQVTASTSSAQSMHESHLMAALMLSLSSLLCRNREEHRAGWGWVVGWGSCCHRRSNITPTLYQIDTKLPPLAFLTFRRLRRGDPPAASALSVPAGHGEGMGEW